MNTTTNTRILDEILAAPFPADQVRWLPKVVKDKQALAIAYADVGSIQSRLDAALGVAGWQEEYTPMADGAVMCRLSIRVADEWVTKCDVGTPSKQTDAGDRTKAAFSNALKRAALKFGIGRYLRRIKPEWCAYDQARKQFTQTPKLPAWALPALPTKAAEPKPAEPKSGVLAKLPTNGPELAARLGEKDKALAAAGRCPAGALIAHVKAAGTQAGFPQDLARWNERPALELAVDAARSFQAQLPTVA